MNEKGILLDKDVMFGYCFGREQPDDFFQYLSNNPELGLTTGEDIRQVIEEVNQRVSVCNIHKVDRRVEKMVNFLKREEIEKRPFAQNIRKVNAAYRRLIGWEKNCGFPSYYREILVRPKRVFKNPIRGVKIGDIVTTPAEYSDRRMVAKAVTLKPKYEKMYLASKDHHIHDSKISQALEKEFGIITGRPQNILCKIK